MWAGCLAKPQLYRLEPSQLTHVCEGECGSTVGHAGSAIRIPGVLQPRRLLTLLARLLDTAALPCHRYLSLTART